MSDHINQKMRARLEETVAKFERVEESMLNPDVLQDQTRYRELARQRSELMPTVEMFREYLKVERSIQEAEELLRSGEGEEMKNLAKEELEELRPRIDELHKLLKIQLLPRDPLDSKNIILEIRAGAGGDEAALFAGDLYRMYVKHAEEMGWRQELLESHTTGVGGLKNVVVSFQGESVYSVMKYESGVHRVQRVPATEASGRIHTSTVTVAVLPEAEDVDVEIRPEDLAFDVFRSSGPGGQSVNTTDSAVRVTHKPTGLVVSCQDEKSQLKNKAKALRVLRARLLDIERAKADAQRAENRKSQVGTGERSERIRTYNFPQGRLTDHRINLTLYQLQHIMEGHLTEVITALRLAEQERLLNE